MAPRATGFAKKPPAPADEAPRVEMRAPRPEDDLEPPDPIPIDLSPLVAPYRKRGRVTVRVERLPHRARLSHGQNNGDRSWSVALDELEGLAYLPASSANEIQSLAIRIIRVDAGDAATLAVLDYPLPSAAASSAGADVAAVSGSEKELRKLRDELAKATATLEARTFELAELRRTAAPKQTIEAELAAMRAEWEAEVEDRLALAAKAAAADLEKSRSGWRAEEEARNLRVEKSARDKARQDAAAELAKAQADWKAQEAGRLAAAEAKWRQQSAKALAEAAAELEKVRASAQRDTASIRSDDSELRRLRDELAKAKATLAARDEELAKTGSDLERLRGEKSRLAQLNVELTGSKASLAGRESELAQLRVETETLRMERDRAAAALAAREGELKQARAGAELARAETDKLRGGNEELQRASADLASAKASLAVRDAELARLRTSQEEARSRWRQEAEAAVSQAEKKWKTEEADRLAAEETKWREHSEMAIAEVVARLERAEAQSAAEVERNRTNSDETHRLTDGLARARALLAERENDLVQARLGHEQARERWIQESEAAITKAQQAWKAGEAERIATSQSESMEQANLALADMTAQIKQLEGLLTEAREHNKKLRSRGDSDDFRQLRKEFASLQATLASRESELMQLRSDHEIDRERWTSEARVAVRRADQNWHTEELQESERRHRVQTTRKLVRDGLLTVAFVGLAMLGYYKLAPMLADSPPEFLQPILDQAGISTNRQPQPATAVQATPPSPSGSLVVAKSVNLRAGPSTSAAVLGSLPRNASVIAVERQGNWIHVRYANGTDKVLEGWAFKSYLQDAVKTAPAMAK
jgi:hypothetical protein